MQEKNVEEDCISQIVRLFSTRLYAGKDIPVDEEGLIRMDNFELREDVQQEVQAAWDNLTDDNLPKVADLDGYKKDFHKLFDQCIVDNRMLDVEVGILPQIDALL